jgi:hypothetical protein
MLLIVQCVNIIHRKYQGTLALPPPAGGELQGNVNNKSISGEIVLLPTKTILSKK